MNSLPTKNKKLSAGDQKKILSLLKARFEKNSAWHKGLNWETIQSKLEAHPEKLWSLDQMEASGGEPALVGYDKKANECIFFDCSTETPAGRRSFCYDGEALASRKANKPADSAVNAATEMGIELLSEEEYQQLQQLGKFDLKTSSWLKTPEPVRKLGGAIFGDRRFDRVFIYHNGAESYYAARGFRGSLRV
jgi:hypothetical protein